MHAWLVYVYEFGNCMHASLHMVASCLMIVADGILMHCMHASCDAMFVGCDT